jgi:hypothetical protein
MNNDGKIFFEVGDKVKPRVVLKPDEAGKPTKMPHPKAHGGIKWSDRGQITERGLEDTVAYVDDASLQIQLASWLAAADAHAERLGGMRARWESYEWYDAVEPEEEETKAEEPKAKARRGGTGSPQAA